MKTKKLIVLDFTTGECHVYTITEQPGIELPNLVYNFLIEHEHIPSSCEWMTTNENIIIHN